MKSLSWKIRPRPALLRVLLLASLLLPACERPLEIVEIDVRPKIVPAGGQADVTLRVKNAPSGTVYRWRAGSGVCNPQKSDSLTTLYTAPQRNGEDSLTMEAFHNDRYLGRHKITVRVGAAAAPEKRVNPTPAPVNGGSLSAGPPRIAITIVPRSDPTGGTDTSADIAGEVRGFDPAAARVALFALTNYWYVQPLEGSELRKINEQGAWSSWTHTGTAYAALAVDPTFQPKSKITALPSVGSKVLARVIVSPIATFSEGEVLPFMGAHFNPGFGLAKPSPVDDPDQLRGKVLRIDYDVSNGDDYSGAWVKFKVPPAAADAADERAWTKGEGNVSFLLRGDDKAGFTRRLKVELRIPGWGWKVLYINGLTSSWKQYHLRLAEFQFMEPYSGAVGEFVITFENREATTSKGTVYLDDLCFENN